ncbi:putative GATA transcription factor 22 isoform X1 [Primulina eburnea]|uniref:putative GATA transcription factor 22 isoform X1 n=1 Tax=Primulina eburnea TaxID=1245227 RepID=UPI003C6CA412
MDLNISPSAFSTVEQQINEDIDQNPFSCQFLYNSMQNHTAGYYRDHQLYKLQHHHEQEDNFGSSSYNIKNKADPGIKFTLWNEEDHHVPDKSHVIKEAANYNPVQWVPSKISTMQKKMKNSNPNHVTLKINSSVVNMIEDQKIQASHSWETDSSSSISYSNPIRVCSDCNTTKTPLWRSGPKGPKVNIFFMQSPCLCSSTLKRLFFLFPPIYLNTLRRGTRNFIGPRVKYIVFLARKHDHPLTLPFLQSLCNACGIRQRKARRAAMAAASAAANGMAVVLTDEPPSLKTIKLKKKEKISKKRNPSSFKKHCKMAATAAAGSSSNGDMRKKLDLEDFLINLSKNLAFRFRVFPQDEKDAAILLMALSSGLIHG